MQDEHEQNHMDRDVHLKRAKMEMTNMSPGADTDQNLHRDWEYKMQKIRMEGKLMQERVKMDTKVHLQVYVHFH